MYMVRFENSGKIINMILGYIHVHSEGMAMSSSNQEKWTAEFQFLLYFNIKEMTWFSENIICMKLSWTCSSFVSMLPVHNPN